MTRNNEVTNLARLCRCSWNRKIRYARIHSDIHRTNNILRPKYYLQLNI